MLNENIKAVRRAKGLSQEALAIRLNVVRQTVSKWERGLSVPDSEMLVSVSEVLETPVSVLLGETLSENSPDDLKSISQKLEIINSQLAREKAAKRRILHWAFILLFVANIATFAVIGKAGSPYLEWDYGNPEIAVVGVALHAFEFCFVRIAPFILTGTIVGAVLTLKKN